MSEVAGEAPVALFKKRAPKGKLNIRKRAGTPSDSGSESSSEDEVGQKSKRRRTNGVITKAAATHQADLSTLKPTEFAANPSTDTGPTNDATKTAHSYDGADADTLSSKNLLGTARNNALVKSDGSTYKGAAGYQSFIQKNPDAPSRQIGPMKASSNVRTITITDFAPDVCKDYKQTGFCGFGDNCKFLHAREDYKQGWELDKEWEKAGKGNKKQGTTVASRSGDTADDAEAAEDALLEKIPFKCIICKEAYKNPIVTKCGHYFCEKCALQRYRKTPSCAACATGTGGVFNGAKQLKRLLEKKAERARKRKEKAREAGEAVSSDEDEEA